jgi:hypothetical protein
MEESTGNADNSNIPSLASMSPPFSRNYGGDNQDRCMKLQTNQGRYREGSNGFPEQWNLWAGAARL